MAQIVSYNASVPTNFNDSISRTVPTTQIILAEFGLTIPTIDTDVVLSGSVGLRSALGAPDVLFRVLRDSSVIASTISSPLAILEFRNIPLSFVDRNVTTVFHVYRLTAQLSTSSITTNATVVGPVSLIGNAIQD
ncbi:hypothetical protein ABE41_008785 [Fictibacillus arsenicus]|uniref:Exosporium protein C n=1 Tax=Fictibacillus arsenicus TaxID=255247 RepID=A0A1B1Z3V4_9BACL|nr:hypothetical protein [Fictibacillus arsenicus]ANX12100.1 hypothetical protein ABE41_008785 [Fictibacillus arsenicus]